MAITRLESQGPATGLHRGNSCYGRRIVWRPRSTDASYAPRLSILTMNSFVILTTNTEFISGIRPRVSFMKTYFKMGRASPDIVCSDCSLFGCLSCNPATISGQRTVTVIMVTRNGLLPTQSCVTRVGSAPSVMTLAIGESNIVYPGIPPFPPAPAELVGAPGFDFRKLPFELAPSNCVSLKEIYLWLLLSCLRVLAE
jgi:hypothetical protein